MRGRGKQNGEEMRNGGWGQTGKTKRHRRLPKKGKRGGGAEWGFSKSRKVGRSPPVENRMIGIEELLRKMREEMVKGLAEVNDRGKKIRKEMGELKKEIKERDEGLRERWDGMERRMDGMEKRVGEWKEIK